MSVLDDGKCNQKIKTEEINMHKWKIQYRQIPIGYIKHFYYFLIISYFVYAYLELLNYKEHNLWTM